MSKIKNKHLFDGLTENSLLMLLNPINLNREIALLYGDNYTEKYAPIEIERAPSITKKQQEKIDKENLEYKINNPYIVDFAQRTGYPIEKIPFPQSYGEEVGYPLIILRLYDSGNYWSDALGRVYDTNLLFPKTTLLAKNASEFGRRRELINEAYSIPFIPEKEAVYNGATFSTNLLDSIALHANKLGIDMKTAIAPFIVESKLGHFPYTLVDKSLYKDYQGDNSFSKSRGYATPMEGMHAGFYTTGKSTGELNTLYGLKDAADTEYYTDYITKGNDRKEHILIQTADAYLKEKTLSLLRINYLKLKDDTVINLDPYTVLYNYWKTGKWNAKPTYYQNANKEATDFIKSKVYKDWLQSRKKANGGYLPTLQDQERNNINYQKSTNNLPPVRFDNGGKLKNYNELSMFEKNEVIATAVRNGIRDPEEIRIKYNEFINN